MFSMVLKRAGVIDVLFSAPMTALITELFEAIPTYELANDFKDFIELMLVFLARSFS